MGDSTETLSSLPHDSSHKKEPGRISRALRVLGPGIVTGAADDDPSGIATYGRGGS